MMAAKAVWKVGEVWVGHGERTGRDKGVGGRGGEQGLWDLRVALYQGKVVPGKRGDCRASLG